MGGRVGDAGGLEKSRRLRRVGKCPLPQAFQGNRGTGPLACLPSLERYLISRNMMDFFSQFPEPPS